MADVLALKKARSVLRAAARRHIRLNAYSWLRDHDRKLPARVFHAIIAFLALTRLGCIATLSLAWAGWFADPRYWSTGAKITAAHTTPFHGHPNLFGWRLGFQGIATTEVETILEQIHTENDGTVEWTEFAKAVESRRRGWKQPWMTTAEGEEKEGLRTITDAELAAWVAEKKGDLPPV